LVDEEEEEPCEEYREEDEYCFEIEKQKQKLKGLLLAPDSIFQ
jgi:hypothetical protein